MIEINYKSFKKIIWTLGAVILAYDIGKRVGAYEYAKYNSNRNKDTIEN